MTDLTCKPIEGGCRCGQVRFRASAFSLSAAIPAPAFEVTAGEPRRQNLISRAVSTLHK